MYNFTANQFVEKEWTIDIGEINSERYLSNEKVAVMKEMIVK